MWLSWQTESSALSGGIRSSFVAHIKIDDNDDNKPVRWGAFTILIEPVTFFTVEKGVCTYPKKKWRQGHKLFSIHHSSPLQSSIKFIPLLETIQRPKQTIANNSSILTNRKGILLGYNNASPHTWIATRLKPKHLYSPYLTLRSW